MSSISPNADLSACLPPIGEFPIVLGDSFIGKQPGFHMLKYEFKPASVDVTKAGELIVNDTNKAKLNLSHQNSEENFEFSGNFMPKVQDCLLIWDADEKVYRLEKMEGFATMRHNRKPSRNSMKGSFNAGTGDASSPSESTQIAQNTIESAPKSTAEKKEPAKKRKTEMLGDSVSQPEAVKKTKRSNSASQAKTPTAKSTAKKTASTKTDKPTFTKVKNSPEKKKQEEGSDMEDLLADLDEEMNETSPSSPQDQTNPSQTSPHEAVDNFEEEDDFEDEDDQESTKSPQGPIASGPVDMFGRPIIGHFDDSDEEED